MHEPTTDEQRMAELLAMNPALLQPEAIELREEVKRLRTELAERQRLSTSPTRDDLTGLETLCALLHGANDMDPAVKDVAWRAFALIRVYRERDAERDTLEQRLQCALDSERGASLPEPATEVVELDGEVIIALETVERGTPVSGWTVVGTIKQPDLRHSHVLIRNEAGQHYATPYDAWTQAAARDRVTFTPVRVTPQTVGTTRYELVEPEEGGQ